MMAITGDDALLDELIGHRMTWVPPGISPAGWVIRLRSLSSRLRQMGRHERADAVDRRADAVSRMPWA